MAATLLRTLAVFVGTYYGINIVLWWLLEPARRGLNFTKGSNALVGNADTRLVYATAAGLVYFLWSVLS